MGADRPEIMAPYRKEKGYAYDLFSDASLAAARAFGIAYRLDESTWARYTEYGLDLEERTGYEHHGLPVPGVFVVNAEGVIEFTYVNPDHRIRLSPRVLLAAARAVAGKEEEDR